MAFKFYLKVVLKKRIQVESNLLETQTEILTD